MKNIYMVMNIYIYGTFEKESQWKGESLSSGRNHTDYIYVYMYINQGYHPRRKIRRRIEWDGPRSIRAQTQALAVFWARSLLK